MSLTKHAMLCMYVEEDHFASGWEKAPFKNLPISTRVKSLISLFTVDEKNIHLSDNTSFIPRLGLPAYEWWSESLDGIGTNGLGINFNGPIKGSTSFPHVILTAVAFNQTLWHSIASAVVVE
ncbi:hypothetical protein HAX54_016334, partial [Datura stramonium]|nr:hypothetical protein [Datura stramonium]